MQWRNKFKLILLSCLLTSVVGCSTISYYSHLMSGHFDLMSGEQPIEDLINRGQIDKELQKKLQQVLIIRRFAVTELGLPDNDSYKTFVKLDRKYPVWNVIAAEKYSVKAKQWCFLIVGCISYRGYFNKQDAEAKAAELKAEGYDVYVSGAAAYSTLGWFDDPVLSSMLYKEESHLAGIIFHELAHQRLYIDDDSSFNEAFATAVELEGVRRWMKQRSDSKANQRYRLYKTRQKDFNTMLRITRESLKQLYASESDQQQLASGKKRIFTNMQKHYQQLKKKWKGYKGYDKWMQKELNNAHLALVATYHERVPAFESILQSLDYNIPRFYAEVERIGEMDQKDRNAYLESVQLKRVTDKH